MTSGSPGIDYFVSSELFETSVSIEAREARRNAGTASDILKAAITADAAANAADAKDAEALDVDGRDLDVDGTSHVPPDHRQSRPRSGVVPRMIKQRDTEGVDGDSVPEQRREGGGDGEQDYAEQLVLFDSLTASLPEAYGPANVPSTMAATLAATGASSFLSAAIRSISGGDHFYHCIQHAKKLHPTFDRVLRGVLQTDPVAKILLAAGSEVGVNQTVAVDMGERMCNAYVAYRNSARCRSHFFTSRGKLRARSFHTLTVFLCVTVLLRCSFDTTFAAFRHPTN